MGLSANVFAPHELETTQQAYALNLMLMMMMMVMMLWMIIPLQNSAKEFFFKYPKPFWKFSLINYACRITALHCLDYMLSVEFAKVSFNYTCHTDLANIILKGLTFFKIW